MLHIVFSNYSSYDLQRYERDASRLARNVIGHWRRYVRRKKQGNPMTVPPPQPAMVQVVEDVVEATETSALLT